MYGCNGDTPMPAGPATALPFGVLSEEPTGNTLPFATLVAQSEANGFTYTTLNDSALIVHIPATFTPSIIASPEKGISPRQALEEHNLKIVVGSGYATSATSLQPIGLLKLNGQEVSPLEPLGYTRIVGFKQDASEADQPLRVVHRNQLPDGLFTDAMQVGPGIIEAGVLDISEKDLLRQKYFRSFVALCTNETLLGVTTTPMHLRTLGEQLVALFESKRMPCTEVINFAGDRQAALAFTDDAGRTYFHGDPEAARVTLLGFR